MTTPARCVLVAVGEDRPGIVAAVTKMLFDLGCNLEDSTMALLAGQFAILLVVGLPEGEPEQEGIERLRSALSGLEVGMGLVCHVFPAPPVGSRTEGRPWSVNVYGADKPGIVFNMSTLLAERGANVVDLTTRMIPATDAARAGSDRHGSMASVGWLKPEAYAEGAHEATYVLVMTVALPPDVSGDALAREVSDLAAILGIHASMHPLDADVL